MQLDGDSLHVMSPRSPPSDDSAEREGSSASFPSDQPSVDTDSDESHSSVSDPVYLHYDKVGPVTTHLSTPATAANII